MKPAATRRYCIDMAMAEGELRNKRTELYSTGVYVAVINGGNFLREVTAFKEDGNGGKAWGTKSLKST